MELLEDGVVSPPSGSVLTTSILLSFLDLFWFSCCPLQLVFFYELPHPTLHLKQIVVPDLKRSLSLALQYFFPFAGYVIFPPPPEKPYIRYGEGDSIRFTVFESASDFNHLASSNIKGVGEILSLVPKQSPPYKSPNSGMMQQPIMEIQITLFPDKGFSIGITFLHIVADGRAFHHFMSSWASIQRSGGNSNSIEENSLPFHERDLIKDPGDLGSVFLKYIYNWERSPPCNNVRKTFVMSRRQIEELKTRVATTMGTTESSSHVSTFVVCCAYMWVCLVKSEHEETCKDEDDNTLHHFIFLADYRNSEEFPVPPTFFGNCLLARHVSIKKSELVGREGFVSAVRAIGGEIRRMKEGPLNRVEEILTRTKDIVKSGKDFLTVAGSPKHRAYETDFGWGKPKMINVAHIASCWAFSIRESRDEDGGVELGLALDLHHLDAFATLFDHGLKLP